MQPRRPIRQRELFEPTVAIPRPDLPKQVQEELTRSLVQWLQTLAKVLRKERGDE